MLTLILVVVAGASLILGWLLGMTILVYVALGVSAVGLVVMGSDAWLRRRRSQAEEEESEDEPKAEDESEDAADATAEDDDAEDADAEAAEESEDEPETAPVPVPVAEAEKVAEDAAVLDALDPSAEDPLLSEDSVVLVVAGRRRFHRPSCPSLDGKDYEELTLIEARDESFTPCTLCIGVNVPDVSSARSA